MSAFPLQEVALVFGQEPRSWIQGQTALLKLQVSGLAHETLGGTVPCQLGDHDGLMTAWGYFLFCSYNNYYILFLSQKGFQLFLLQCH